MPAKSGAAPRRVAQRGARRNQREEQQAAKRGGIDRGIAELSGTFADRRSRLLWPNFRNNAADWTAPWNDSPPRAASWNDSPPRAGMPTSLASCSPVRRARRRRRQRTVAAGPRSVRCRTPLAAARIDFDNTGEVWSSAPWSARSPLTPDERQLRAEERGASRGPAAAREGGRGRQEGERHLRRAHGAYVGAASSAHAITRLRDEAAADQRRAVARGPARRRVAGARGGSPPPSSRRPPLATATTSFAPPSARRRSASPSRALAWRAVDSEKPEDDGAARVAAAVATPRSTPGKVRAAVARASEAAVERARLAEPCQRRAAGGGGAALQRARLAAAGAAEPHRRRRAREARGRLARGGATSDCTARGGRRRRAAATAASSSIGRRGGGAACQRRILGVQRAATRSPRRARCVGAGPSCRRRARRCPSSLRAGTPRGRPAQAPAHARRGGASYGSESGGSASARRPPRWHAPSRRAPTRAAPSSPACSRASTADRAAPARRRRPPSPARDAPPPLAATRPPPLARTTIPMTAG